MRTTSLIAIYLTMIALLGAGCSGSDRGGTPTASPRPAITPFAQAVLRTPQGVAIGAVTASEEAGGIRIELAVERISPGPHGVHVHTIGKCDPPDFMSAGGHWNPGGHQHGLDNPAGAHAGDMPNLVAGRDGRGVMVFRLRGGTRAGLLDGDGAAFVVHAGPDDQRTDPSGNSGGRIACGVFEPA